MARVESYLDHHSTSCVEVAPLNGDPGAPGEGAVGGLHAHEIWRLRRDPDKTEQVSLLFVMLYSGNNDVVRYI